MKKLYLILTVVIMSVCAYGQAVCGQIVNADALPIEFANISLLTEDSVFAGGAVSDKHGHFSVQATAAKRYLLNATCIGYVTKTITAHTGDTLRITMKRSSYELEGITVKKNKPIHTLTAEGIFTKVEGTVLSKLGQAKDMLRSIPGIFCAGNAIEVFGRGTPVIYINGRQMRNTSELDNLRAEDIESVEVINNPGVKYDASITAVLKIKTKKAAGDGLGTVVTANLHQGEETTNASGTIDINYRHKAIDIFGYVSYFKNNEDDLTRIDYKPVNTQWIMPSENVGKRKNQTFSNMLGANYTIDNDNSVGIKYSQRVCPDTKSALTNNSSIIVDNNIYDKVYNELNGAINYDISHFINGYYIGKAGRLGIDFNVDFLASGEKTDMSYHEESEQNEARIFDTYGKKRNRMAASKLVLTHPVLGGTLSVGAEYTYTKRKENSDCTKEYVPQTDYELHENKICPFAEYTIESPIGGFTAGVRYEHVESDYTENGVHSDEQSRTDNDWFPALSWRKNIGKVQLKLGYNTKMFRPAFWQLRSDVTYGNRYSLESGNPLLKPETSHCVNLSGLWNFLYMSVDYYDIRNAIMWSSSVVDAGNMIIKTMPTNHDLKSIGANMSINKQTGTWYANLNAGITKQWFSIGDTYMGRPLWQVGMNNSIEIAKLFTLTVYAAYSSKGDSRNTSANKPYFTMNTYIYAPIIRDKLLLWIWGQDIFKTNKSDNNVYTGYTVERKRYENDSRKISVTLQFRFNTTKSKYKGTGAGNDEKRRF